LAISSFSIFIFVLKTPKVLKDKVAQKMAAINETVVLENGSHFNFEEDTEDSDYLGVKRIEFKRALHMSESNEEDTLDRHLKATKTLVLKKETIQLLPNVIIQLTIRLKQIRKIGLVEINLLTTECNERFNIEVVGLCTSCDRQSCYRETDVRHFTKSPAEINLYMTPFELNLFMTPFELSPCASMRGGLNRLCSISLSLVLKVPNDLNSSITAIPKLFSEGEYSDVKIICKDQTFRCHKVILALQSDVFKAMLDTNQCTEQITGTVRVDDINAKTMNTLLKYLYQNKITYEEATDLNLIVAANKYNIVDLVSKCEQIILLTMSMENIMDILAVAKLLPTPNLFKKALLFFNQRTDHSQVQHGLKWLELKTQNPALALEITESCLNMKICSKEEVKCNGGASKTNKTTLQNM
jgi:hypothetical protein